MRLLPVIPALLLSALAVPVAAAPGPAPAVAAIPYGANTPASGTFTHDGVTFYYETYGKGDPLLLVHGNGGSIAWMKAQIDYFKDHRRVIAMDSRGQGRSGDSAAPLTYEQMTDDLAALIDHLKVGPVDVVGWSDGAIEALLLGARHPAKVRKLVAMAANLDPDALYPEMTALVKEMVAAVPPEPQRTPEDRRHAKVTAMMLSEPQIAPALLKSVSAPTLVVSGDYDLIRLGHTIAIFEALPNAQLAVLPDSTHMLPFDDPKTFNALAEHFLATPFRKRDRIPDTMSSYDRLVVDLPK